ncbi:aminotransferase class III-fold pyridoxal phosphate-dependent enzyme [Marinobacterium sp. D7]|uniref:aminotransferase class III-fold pyridoxal phosphate-dependent enzyme n=1 Tax=Marinobacterium ramblicola TaxID=2849041 RepID=UPI001C2D0975|nr:aminotransferase class III-fold pyridoxal phosphate-dependent enzyme [Marinobacterium ramblicola]MBV1790714.1 aminotransferase class III-fold pyridoxal phosphate-dependent enzyme [Marinobacterium ramblicola]
MQSTPQTKTQNFWNPMAHPGDPASRNFIQIVKGDGNYVQTAAGDWLVDGVGGLWNVNVGHNRQEVKDAINAQLNELEYFQIFDGCSHPCVHELADRLIEMTKPEGMSKAMFSSGGSDAVETALKLARQYWKAVGQSQRYKFISLKQGYHGVHFGGASINGNTVFRTSYEPMLPGCIHIDTPWLYRNPWNCEDPEQLGQLCAAQLEAEIIFQGPETVAAFIAEPVQGAGGVIVPPANYWPLVRQVCDKYGVLLIADEVVTGFGRSGSMFGVRGWGVKADIQCFAKGINSGYIPLGATLVNERISSAIEGCQSFTGAVMHGYTYSGHPVACAAALASLKIVEQENLPQNAAVQGELLKRKLEQVLLDFPAIGEIRGKGLMIAIDLVANKKTREPIDPTKGYANRIAAVTMREGAIVRPVGTKIILSPTLTLTETEVEKLTSALKIAFQEVKA